MPDQRPARLRTLGGPVSHEGAGIHTGATSRVTLGPAGPGTGIRFRQDGIEFAATTEHVTGTRRSTGLGCGGACVDTVEHLLSVLAGLCIDDLLVDVEGREIPALDGSGAEWVSAVREAGIVEQDGTPQVLVIDEPICLQSGPALYMAAPSDEYDVVCMTDYEHPMLGPQATRFRGDLLAFEREVAPARTFGFWEEVEALLGAGLAAGASLDNCVVVYQDHFSTGLRHPDECCRHKLLDLLGDLSLVGHRIRARIVAVGPGHRGNVLLASELRRVGRLVPGA